MTHYFIIGADGREYGPASEEEIRLWVRERRAGGRTQVRREGESAWRPLAEFSELASALDPSGSDSRREESVPPPMPGEGEAIALEVFRRDPVLNIGEAFARGWDLLVEHWVVVGVATALGGLLLFGGGAIPVVGIAAAFCMLFMVLGGVELAILRLLRGERVDIGVAFVGFSPPLVLPLFLSGVGGWGVGPLGVLLCIVPGVYLGVCWLVYTPLLIADRRLDFWQALECSRRVVTRYWWPNLGLFFLVHLVVAAGLLACGVGVLVALPLALAAMVVAYEETFGSLGDESIHEGEPGLGDGGAGGGNVVGEEPPVVEVGEAEAGLVVRDAVGPVADGSGEETVVGSQERPDEERQAVADLSELPKTPKRRSRAAASRKRVSKKGDGMMHEGGGVDPGRKSGRRAKRESGDGSGAEG
ncbi:MAG: DUF4339 domain-containing protein [Limisphaerales bacterium]